MPREDEEEILEVQMSPPLNISINDKNYSKLAEAIHSELMAVDGTIGEHIAALATICAAILANVDAAGGGPVSYQTFAVVVSQQYRVVLHDLTCPDCSEHSTH